MPSILAAIVFAIGILGLFWLDRDRKTKTSLALWLPIMWLSIGASRNVAQWMGTAPLGDSASDVLEGNPLDRAILSGLILSGAGVLLRRWPRTTAILRKNIPLVIFFVYCGASILWSDFPFVAFKRWTKVLGNVVMALVVLTELDAAAALKRLLTRTAFILIPASVLVIRYFAYLGRFYDRWEGDVVYTGVASDKNMLGVLCLVLGFGIVARFCEGLRDPQSPARRTLATGTVLAMAMWLLFISDSATSVVCFLVGSALIVLSIWRGGRPAVVHIMVGTMILAGVGALLLPSAFVFFVELLGRDATLTGRTELWSTVLALNTSPWFGAGFESFFLGDRLTFLWAKYWWRPNQAHNGYLEVYLTLGIVGMFFLGLLLVTGYRKAIAVYRQDPVSGSLRLALIVAALAYNVTEAAFKVMHPMWIMLLLSVTGVPLAKIAVEKKTATTPARPAAFDPRRRRGLRGTAAVDGSSSPEPARSFTPRWVGK
jgi:O-antigen ligase